MPEQTPSGPPTSSDFQAQLPEIVRLLREAHHLSPEARQTLADLVEELGKSTACPTPSAETAHLTDTAAQLARALHQRQDAGPLAAAKEKLEEAAVRAEAEAPLAAGIVRRLIDALTNLGI
jgi:hypothetical protein